MTGHSRSGRSRQGPLDPTLHDIQACQSRKRNKRFLKDGIPSKGQFVPTLVLVFIKKKKQTTKTSKQRFNFLHVYNNDDGIFFFLFFLQREIYHIFPSMGQVVLFWVSPPPPPRIITMPSSAYRGHSRSSVGREKVVQTKPLTNVRSDIFILSGREKTDSLNQQLLLNSVCQVIRTMCRSVYNSIR